MGGGGCPKKWIPGVCVCVCVCVCLQTMLLCSRKDIRADLGLLEGGFPVVVIGLWTECEGAAPRR